MLETRIVRDMTSVDHEVNGMVSGGCVNENIYLFAKDEELTVRLAAEAGVQPYRITEKGLWESLMSKFTKNSDDRIDQLESLGLTKEMVESLEGEIQAGKIVLVCDKS
ncbi:MULTISPECIES: general stress protein [Exiguobacterium]|uniref:general stress protein n=1 Tax=Exiguobacterium TaxID=33986 RepID=UPI001E50E4DB|nr:MULTISPECIES: general stress protein [Exiguobacterium]